MGLIDEDSLFAAAIELMACARISPLAQWPHGYSAGVVHALIALRAEHDAEEARQMRRAAEG